MLIIKNPYLLGLALVILEVAVNLLAGDNLLNPLIYLLPVGVLVGTQLKPAPGHGLYSFKVIATYTALVLLIAVPSLTNSFDGQLFPLLVSAGYLVVISAFGYLFFVLGQQMANKFINKRQNSEV